MQCSSDNQGTCWEYQKALGRQYKDICGRARAHKARRFMGETASIGCVSNKRVVCAVLFRLFGTVGLKPYAINFKRTKKRKMLHFRQKIPSLYQAMLQGRKSCNQRGTPNRPRRQSADTSHRKAICRRTKKVASILRMHSREAVNWNGLRCVSVSSV